MLRVEEIDFYREEHINFFSNIKRLALKTYMSKLYKLSMFYLGIHIYTHKYIVQKQLMKKVIKNLKESEEK